MKLPHLSPLVFAKRILNKTDNHSEVLCEFDQKPTFGMFVEAAAQATASFFQEDRYKLGFLVNAANIELLSKIVEYKYIVKLDLQIKFDNLAKYSFEIMSFETKTATLKGELTIAFQE
jgi:hypothetical protein